MASLSFYPYVGERPAVVHFTIESNTSDCAWSRPRGERFFEALDKTAYGERWSVRFEFNCQHWRQLRTVGTQERMIIRCRESAALWS